MSPLGFAPFPSNSGNYLIYIEKSKANNTSHWRGFYQIRPEYSQIRTESKVFLINPYKALERTAFMLNQAQGSEVY